MKNSTSVVYEGGDGSSIEKAVVIKGAADTFEGTGAESAWIQSNHPGWEMDSQALLNEGDKDYDRIEYTTPATSGPSRTGFESYRAINSHQMTGSGCCRSSNEKRKPVSPGLSCYERRILAQF